MNDEATEGIRFAWKADRSRLPAGEGARLRVLVSAEAPSREGARAPLNIGLVMDRSGSMRGEKLRATLESARLLVDRLSGPDRLSVVFYDTVVETALKPTEASDRRALLGALEEVRARGTTNLSGGWLQGLRLVEKARSRESVNRLLLMTDGRANRGITDPAALENVARKARKKGVVTTTLGFGASFNEDLLAALAAAGGGRFHFIETPDDAPGAFASELGDAMELAAQNLQGRIRPAPGISLDENLNRFPASISGGDLEVFPGDVFAGETRTLLFSLKVPPGPAGTRDLFTATFEFDDLSDAGASREAALSASLPAGADAAPAPPEDARQVRLAEALFRTGTAKEQARARADRGDWEGGAAVLEKALRALDGVPEAPEVELERRDLRRFADDFRKRSFGAVDRKNLSASIFRSQAGRLSAPGKKKIIETRHEKDDPPGGGT